MAHLTLQEILDSADRQNRDDKEHRDEAHPLFLYKRSHRAAVTALHLTGRWLRAPGKKAHADD